MQYLWELNGLSDKKITAKLKQIHVYKTPMEALDQAHAVAILTEWDGQDLRLGNHLYKKCIKPAFVFFDRNILDADALTAIGFQVRE
jgi:UDPglucose 6-dehydrogenase